MLIEKSPITHCTLTGKSLLIIQAVKYSAMINISSQKFSRSLWFMLFGVG